MHTQLPSPRLQRLCHAVDRAQHDALHGLLRELAAGVALAHDPLADLPEAARAGSAERYTRHVAYADPAGRYTVVYLVWRPGQFSPVHGHKTWCAYRVLQGELTETHYRWDAGSEIAQVHGGAQRRAGDIITATPGLGQIHRLGNAGPDTAISLHVYGVTQADIATGVNLLVPTHPLHD
ncbi:cysteine dioxygenase [Bordetella genomosp. 1]|uniref:Cysteine dioxygenase n=1 Tax=Bordetella genomosp. 1 TaxID=1395607 RepID=A0A261SXX2_9BORD|nr:cysteine dioxygenase family protein [Bordetella genomosp. 1]OZI41163.1 cysteine dioxygenase [Bordetella genomosp. 1]OZI69385.1 cysteine dioxygenase [Bordetella genomosp. 1]